MASLAYVFSGLYVLLVWIHHVIDFLKSDVRLLEKMASIIKEAGIRPSKQNGSIVHGFKVKDFLSSLWKSTIIQLVRLGNFLNCLNWNIRHGNVQQGSRAKLAVFHLVWVVTSTTLKSLLLVLFFTIQQQCRWIYTPCYAYQLEWDENRYVTKNWGCGYGWDNNEARQSQARA